PESRRSLRLWNTRCNFPGDDIDPTPPRTGPVLIVDATRGGNVQPSMFNLRVPLEARDEVFLMNTLTDAQVVVSSDVAAILDRWASGDRDEADAFTAEEREAIGVLAENGFLVASRASEREALDKYFTSVQS